MSANQSRYDPLQTIRIGRPAPPTVQDPSPWQLALQGKAQDTGGGEGAPGPWSDNTPVQGGAGQGVGPGATPAYVPFSSPGTGGGAFGTTYTDPGGGWNPWSLYDSRQGYDGTAVDGYYNAAADTVRHDSGRGDGSTMNSRDTVWRWTLDDLGKQYGGNPGSAPPEAVKAAFLNNVARLKRDWNAPENAGRGDWANSGFAGYDQFARGGAGQGSGVGGAAQAAARAGSGAVQRAAGQQGGTGMADQTGGAAAAAAAAAGRAAGNQVGQSTSNTFTGQTQTHTPGTYGQFSTPDIESVLAEIQADPGKAALIWRAMQGYTKPALGRMEGTRDTLYGQSLQAYLGLAGLPGMGSATDLLSGFNNTVSHPGGLAGLGNQVAGKLGGMGMGSLSSLDLDKLLSTVAALKGVNMGKLGKSAMGQQLQNVQEQDWLHQAAGGMAAGQTNYAGDLTDTDYGRALMQYLGAQ